MTELDGLIKFNCDRHQYQNISAFPEFAELTAWRAQLHNLGLIGQDSQGIGYGNVSIKSGDSLYITASQTGHLPHLDLQDYVQIRDYDFASHTLISQGQQLPSSETATHFAIYQISSAIRAVFHIHHAQMWQMMITNKYPQTPPSVQYGTQAMVQAVINLYQSMPNPFAHNLFAMAGHTNGIFSFGRNCNEAGQVLLQLHRLLH